MACDPGAALVYEALADLVDGCMKELRKLERLDTADLTPTNGLSSAFDENIRRQLAPIWHTVSPKTRQIVTDLRTLRTLAGMLNKLDPVTFLNYLDTLRATEGTRCAWLFHSAAHTVFEAAKARVYRLSAPGEGPSAIGAATKKRKGGPGDAPTSLPTTTASAAAGGVVPALQPILDELPKWHALLEILEEARQERARTATAATTTGPDAATGVDIADNQEKQQKEKPQASTSKAPPAPQQQSEPPSKPPSSSSFFKPQPPPILVFCQDEYTCAQLREVAGPSGPGGLMRRVYCEYLQYKIDSGVSGGKKGGNGPNDGVPTTRMMGGYAPGEEAALAKEARGLGATRGPGQGRGRGRVGGRGGGGRGRNNSKAALATATSALKGGSNTAIPSSEGITIGDNNDGEGGPINDAATGLPRPVAGAQLVDPEDVRFAALDTHGPLPLWEVSPTYVIVYDPDVALTRSLELFKAQRRSQPLRVYLLRYEDSPEMDKYQAAVVRERAAFEGLIRAKGIMAPVMAAATGTEVALPRAGSGTGAALPALGPAVSGNALTRRGGGRLNARPERVRVVVDVREFMSPLPAVLHARGLQVVPLTLEVGDYVLSPEICVERKSLSDLRGSLISGRLYQQAEAMCRCYRTAILLIEFEGDRTFALQGVGELSDDIQSHSMMSRLVLLCLHHPRLRLVWSRSLHATADIFKQLKANHEEPDPVAAATVGVNGDEGGQGGESVVNSTAIDLLRRLPGVTDGNWRALMREAGSLAGLAEMPLHRLITVMGGEVQAKKLKEFLAQECRALFKAL